MASKELYETPTLQKVGSAESKTMGGARGPNVDIALPVNFKKSDITFS